MAPPKWATAEEEEFFHSHYARYQVCQAKHSYTGFWEPVFEEWFASFPEWLCTYKDIPLDVELTVEQKIKVANAVEAHTHKIVNKFKNDMGSSKANQHSRNHNNREIAASGASTTAAMTTMAGKSTDSMLGVPGKSVVAQMCSTARDRPVRSPQMSEAFSKLFFESTIKPTLDVTFEKAKAEAQAKAAAENIDIKIPHKIGVIRRQTKLLYILAPDEIKQQVAELTNILTEFFEELQRLTGYVFTVLMGGPTPAMGGQIDVQSFHIGTTEVGNQFDQAYPEFNSGIMKPWKEFSKRIFHESD
ncbi:hypothetical protein EV424DRAFT_1345509 [Suillus variegatus]|nr:hypothetical protein EV424DRAFT_1345509 [Suillus variegatus]